MIRFQIMLMRLISLSFILLHRILTPELKSEKKDSKKRGKVSRKLGKSGQSSLHIMDDGSQMLTSGAPDNDDSTFAGFNDTDELPAISSYEGWKAKYKLPLVSVQVKSVNKRDVVICVEHRDLQQTRHVYFDLESDAQQFVQLLDKEKQEQERRNNIKMKKNLGDIKLTPGENITFLVEIVSGTNLPAADLTTSDPYVQCYLNGVERHKTKSISNTLDPVWTLHTGSLFTFDTTAKELFQGDGLHCDVYDYDTIGKNDCLGHVVIPPRKMYESKGERLEYPLQGEGARVRISYHNQDPHRFYSFFFIISPFYRPAKSSGISCCSC